MDVSAVVLVGEILDISTPWLTDETRVVLSSLVRSRGIIGCADEFASTVGVGNRHRLAYRLRRAGLPHIELLAAWIRVMLWIVEAETCTMTLCRLSLDEDRDPSYRYRLVKRLTGEPWSKVQQMGLVWVLEEFLKICRMPEPSDHAHAGVA